MRNNSTERKNLIFYVLSKLESAGKNNNNKIFSLVVQLSDDLSGTHRSLIKYHTVLHFKSPSRTGYLRDKHKKPCDRVRNMHSETFTAR